MTYLYHWFSEQVGLAGDLGSTNDVLIPLYTVLFELSIWRIHQLNMAYQVFIANTAYSIQTLSVFAFFREKAANNFTLVSGYANSEDSIEEVVTETMTEPTLGEYMEEVRADYGPNTTTLSGTNGEDAVEYIENFIKIVDPLDLPNVSYERLRLSVLPISLTGDASEWLMNEPQSLVTTWVDLTELFFAKYYPPSRTVLIEEAFSDLEETYKDGEHEIAKIFRIKTDIFDFETPLCKVFNEFNYLLKIDTDVFTHDIQGAKTYEEYENVWLNNDVPWDPEEPWSKNGVPYELICWD
ncbi:hypothetical protein Tco_0992528 [Tanacetum coccineum]|uniref:Retrotransposon gag domain-containing protein n=1 Tax=Tanacetum coccineum TaxID=301880 RepID=A0ABQ5F364_9ASTR